ncbi:hypothetical protein T484DRAFT_1917542, partial [Baffinella frigidus]
MSHFAIAARALLLLTAAVGISAAGSHSPSASEGGDMGEEEQRDEWRDAEDQAEEVLHFWFSGEFEHKYRRRWFAKPGSEQQKRVDSEIVRRFLPLVSLAADEGVLFSWEEGRTVDWTAAGALLSWEETPRTRLALFIVLDQLVQSTSACLSWALLSWEETPRTRLALIIVLDQLVRHTHRDHPDAAGIIEQCGRDALDLSEDLLERGWDDLLERGWDVTLTAEERVFAAMPLRHHPTVARLEKVLSKERVFAAMPLRHHPTVARLEKVLSKWDVTLTAEERVFAVMPLRHHPTVARLEKVLSKVEEWSKSEIDPVALELLSRFKRTSL